MSRVSSVQCISRMPGLTSEGLEKPSCIQRQGQPHQAACGERLDPVSEPALSLWDTVLMEIAATVSLVTLHRAPDSTSADSLPFTD